MLNLIYNLHWHFSKAREYPGIHRALSELREECKLEQKEWDEQREQRLRNLLIFAKDHVPYYRTVFSQIGFDPVSANLLHDLSCIPILTKGIIMDHLGELIADTTNRSRIFEDATGGSTGIPLKFYHDQKYHTVAVAMDTYVREWWGVRPYDKTALVWGADREFHELSLKERLYQWRQRARTLNAFRMDERNLLEFCMMLKRWRPAYLMGYSSALEALAKCALNKGIDNLRFKAIRSSAEILWPHQRKLIEEAFRSPVYNFYGSREVNNLAAECPEERRLHLISTWRNVEIVDEEGNPLPEGELGYITVTDLSNFAMPFIRYRNEDMGRIAKISCTCGRPSPVLDELLGRSTDLIRTPRGDIIHGEFFTHLFYGKESIRQFQIHQTDIDYLVIRYVPNGDQPKGCIEGIVDKIREILGREMKVDIEVCDKIPILPSGKHRFTISDVKDGRVKY